MAKTPEQIRLTGLYLGIQRPLENWYWNKFLSSQVFMSKTKKIDLTEMFQEKQVASFLGRDEKIPAINIDGQFSMVVEPAIIGEKIPENYYISNAYPNPFNPETKIEFGLSEPSEVQIQIYNINGQLINKIIDNVSLPAGHYLSRFNGDNISSGIYFFRVFAKSLNSEKYMKKVGKLMLVK